MPTTTNFRSDMTAGVTTSFAMFHCFSSKQFQEFPGTFSAHRVNKPIFSADIIP